MDLVKIGETEVNCPICSKVYKGKIGVGVHLKRGHTGEERSKLYLSYVTNLLPIILAIVILSARTRG